jgi:diguanylate cyclase (GGDEF)-like protein
MQEISGDVRADTLEAARGLWYGETALAEALQAIGPANGTERQTRELRALITVASAVAAAQRVDEVIQTAAEEACLAIRAGWVSVSSLDASRAVLRAIVEVGDQDRGARRKLLAVPIRLADDLWGELSAARGDEQPAFDSEDERFLMSIADQIAAAVGRAEVFSRLSELAFKDGLTGLANRRAFDERLGVCFDEARREGRALTVALCDLDNLKEVNDAHGHAAGDAALIAVASVLADVARGHRDALVARNGGDEFAILLDGADAAAGRLACETLISRLEDHDTIAVSCGVTELSQAAETPADLLRAADAALYAAKRSGRGRVCVSHPDFDGTWAPSDAPSAKAPPGRELPLAELGPLTAEVLSLLDGPLAHAQPVDRLRSSLELIAASLDAAAAAVSLRPSGQPQVHTLYTVQRRHGRVADLRFGAISETFALAEYPQTAELLQRGGSFLVVADDEAADPSERRLLHDYGMDSMLATAAMDGRGAWLAEIYADARTHDLASARAVVALVVREAVRSVAMASPAPLQAV